MVDEVVVPLPDGRVLQGFATPAAADDVADHAEALVVRRCVAVRASGGRSPIP